MSERDLYNEILRDHSRGDVRLFRTNAGDAWQGTIIERTATRIVLAHPRHIRMGAPGISDLIGWSPHEGHAIYTAIEAKTSRGRLREEQSAFLNLVLRCGGRAGVAKSSDDAAKILLSSL